MFKSDLRVLQMTLFLLIFLFTTRVHSQGFKLLDVSYAYYPDAEISEAQNGAESSISELNVAINLPKVFNEGDAVLINGLSYGLVKPTIQNSSSEAGDNLHLISYTLSYVKKVGDKSRLITTFRPSISSQLNSSLTGDDFLFLGSAMIRKKVDDRKSWSAGLVYTSRFGEPIVLPILGYSVKGERFIFDVTLPRSIKGLAYNESKRLEYGLMVAVDGSQFNLNTSDDLPFDNVRFSRVNLGPTVEYGMNEHVFFNLFTGFIANRVYDFTSSSQDDLDFGLENGFFASFGISLQ